MFTGVLFFAGVGESVRATVGDGAAFRTLPRDGEFGEGRFSGVLFVGFFAGGRDGVRRFCRTFGMALSL